MCQQFFAMFCNAFLVTLLVFAQVAGAPNVPLLFKGQFGDFSPQWFCTVGSSLFSACPSAPFSLSLPLLLIAPPRSSRPPPPHRAPHPVTTITQAVLPPLQTSIEGAWFRVTMGRRVRRAYTQRQLNAVFAGHKWRLPMRVAQLLNATYLALSLCGGMPAAGFLLAFVFALSYWSDKYTLLRVSRTPARTGAVMTHRLVGLLAWGAILHFGLTAWSALFCDTTNFFFFFFLNHASSRIHFSRARTCPVFGNNSLPAFRERVVASALGLQPGTGGAQFDLLYRLSEWQCFIQAVPFLVFALFMGVAKPVGRRIVLLATTLCFGAADADATSDVASRMTFTEAGALGCVYWVFPHLFGF